MPFSHKKRPKQTKFKEKCKKVCFLFNLLEDLQPKGIFIAKSSKIKLTMAAAATTPPADETTVLDVLSGKEPIKTDFAITTTWATVAMVVAGFGLVFFLMRYFNKK